MASSDVDSAFFFSMFFVPKDVVSPVIVVAVLAIAALFLFPGGIAWLLSSSRWSIPGPSGITTALSGKNAHRALKGLANSFNAVKLMAFSVGTTRFIVSSHPETAKEILNSTAFADRPIKESAYELLFHRAMGFAPFGEYWRNLRRISSTYLFSPKRISSHGKQRMDIGESMMADVRGLMEREGAVEIKKLLHFASLNSIMMTVFGKRFDYGNGEEGSELEGLVKEGYELLGMFNWSDHLPVIGWLDLQGVRRRCRNLVNRVNEFVTPIIEEHRKRKTEDINADEDFVDALLNLDNAEDKLTDSDMVAVLWEMLFRGTDTVAILLEWVMARMVLHPEIQARAQAEIDTITVGNKRPVCDADIKSLPYLQAIVKETLRMHPPGPLLSWARLAIHDVHVGSHLIPAGTTAMVNMWAISHDKSIWPEPEEFKPERFTSGEDINVMGSDLRLAPFGAGRRVCPGKNMALATVHLWLAQLLQNFNWAVSDDAGVDLSECLKMSMEMENPLICRAIPRF